MKATGRLNSPSNKSKPPKVSIMPPARNSGGRCGIGNGAGKPNNFCVPCTTYTKAAMILRMLKRYGDQRFIGAPFTSISHGQRTAERPRRCGTGARQPTGVADFSVTASSNEAQHTLIYKS